MIGTYRRKIEHLQRWHDELREKYFPEVTCEGEVVYYPNMKGSGMVKSCIGPGKPYHIKIGPKALHNETAAKGVIAHELGHVALGLVQMKWYDLLPIVQVFTLGPRILRHQFVNTETNVNQLCIERGLGAYVGEALEHCL